jgi:hypothetical protein
MTNTLVRTALLGAALLAAAPAALTAQLPPAAELTARYADAIGGRDAYLAVRSTRSRGEFQMPAAGLAGELVSYAALPGRMLMVITIPGVGEIRNGFDGTTAWSIDPFQGARIAEGRELEQMRMQGDPHVGLRDASRFAEMETIGEAEVDGRACYRVRLVLKDSGDEMTDCYDRETGLLLATTMQIESPMGAVETTMRFDDYRQFGPLKMAARMTQEMMGMQQIITISEIEYDGVDVSVFELPAEIRTLKGGGQ